LTHGPSSLVRLATVWNNTGSEAMMDIEGENYGHRCTAEIEEVTSLTCTCEWSHDGVYMGVWGVITQASAFVQGTSPESLHETHKTQHAVATQWTFRTVVPFNTCPLTTDHCMGATACIDALVSHMLAHCWTRWPPITMHHT
jgi:hypothetical protein